MTAPVRCELVSWGGFYELCRRLAFKLRNAEVRPDLIVAIARGGYMPARILSDFLGLMDLTSFRIEHYRGAYKQPLTRVRYPLPADVSGRRVLLVDDVSDTGDTFHVAKEHLQDRSSPAEIKTAVLHHKVVSRFVPDFYAAKVVKWRWITYPWAVVEDLTAFIQAMAPRPESIEGIAGRLEQDHGVRVPRKVLQDVLAMMESRGR